VLIIGHNPDLSRLALLLAGAQVDMPTAAIAIIELPVRRWSSLGRPVKGKLWAYFRPARHLQKPDG
jgi:phosphohistidine phosphatase SixA